MDKSGRGQWGAWKVQALVPEAAFLVGEAAREHSQYGEEGIFQALFAKIGTANRWCLECGAGDGVTLSNTKRFRDQGWSAVLIEADGSEFAKLTQHASATVHCVHRKVSGNDLDVLLTEVGAPTDMDLGVIDVDGIDWYLWNEMIVYRPRVMMVECNHHDHPVPPVGASSGQAGFTAIVELGKAKNYVPVIRTAVNVIFVDAPTWNAYLAARG